MLFRSRNFDYIRENAGDYIGYEDCCPRCNSIITVNCSKPNQIISVAIAMLIKCRSISPLGITLPLYEEIKDLIAKQGMCFEYDQNCSTCGYHELEIDVHQLPVDSEKQPN